MIARLTGKAIRIQKNPLILDVGGVGYAVHVPKPFLSSLIQNQNITVHTHTYVREDALILFGFSSEEEILLFELLLSVSGIGPKTALSVLDLGVVSIQKAIVEADVDFFMSVPRLGRKNAQKIIIDLKSKLGSMTDLDLSETSGATSEIMNALVSMGFDKREAREAVKKLPTDGTLEDKLKFALKMLG